METFLVMAPRPTAFPIPFECGNKTCADSVSNSKRPSRKPSSGQELINASLAVRKSQRSTRRRWHFPLHNSLFFRTPSTGNRSDEDGDEIVVRRLTKPDRRERSSINIYHRSATGKRKSFAMNKYITTTTDCSRPECEGN